MALIRQAFLAISSGYSPDRVVADPDLNNRYIEECRSLGAREMPAQLNRKLLNIRKSGLLKGIKSTNRTNFPHEDEYRYASEIAVRFLEKRDDTTLDHILCDPKVAREFDKIAAGICQGYSPLEYRWAALNLRKASKLKPELMSHVVRPISVELGPVESVDCSRLPIEQGLYIFYGGEGTLYVGEAGCLKKRLEKHLNHSDNKHLARWFWDNGYSEVTLEIQQLPNSTSKKVRKALEAELISSRHPFFNVQRPK